MGEARKLSRLEARWTLDLRAAETMSVAEYECTFSLFVLFIGVPPGDRCTSNFRNELKRAAEIESAAFALWSPVVVAERLSLIATRSLSDTNG